MCSGWRPIKRGTADISFSVTARSGRARTGRLATAHGVVETPAFMPVGTQGTVKTLTVQDLKACGVQILLSNVYHLSLRPGLQILEKAGGLRRFMAWDGPILTDSGGYQVFSLAAKRRIKEEGVTFASHVDGSSHSLTPESVIRFELGIGVDIAVPLDHCVQYPCERAEAEEALERTTRWAERSKGEFVLRQAHRERWQSPFVRPEPAEGRTLSCSAPPTGWSAPAHPPLPPARTGTARSGPAGPRCPPRSQAQIGSPFPA